jgi:hypothetical protein
MTAVPVAVEGAGRYAVSVGVLTLTVVSMPPEPRLASGCFHCSDPGATPGHRLMTFFAIADVAASSGLLLLFSCAFAAGKRETAINETAMKDMRCFLLMESATPILAIHQALKLSRISLSLHIDRRDSIVDRLQIVRRQLYARAAKILFEPV